jgi:sarcosine oxidase
VIGFDRFSPPHDKGSSHGQSRIIRMAYFEDPAYVPLLRLAFDAWRDLETRAGVEILRQTGIMEAGFPGSPIIESVVRSAVLHDLPFEQLSADALNARFPAFSLPSNWDCVFEPNAGFLRPERIIELQLRMALEMGAFVRTNTIVQAVNPIADHVEIRLVNGERIEAGAAIVATGPWIADLVPTLSSSLRLTRQDLVWFEPQQRALVQPDRMPVFFLEAPEDELYGFPDVDGWGVKIASHKAGPGVANADDVRLADTEEPLRLALLLKKYVPAAHGPAMRSQSCLYTRTPDENFIVGLHPSHHQIVIASPCSGHGFKFASVIGEILADLALTEATDKPIDLFCPDRYLPGESNIGLA